jgi:helix-turn-helix, Psq domain
VMFAEMSSPFSSKMADVFADLSKDERVKLAVRKYSKENGLSARKAVKIYRIAPSTITRRLNEQTDSRRAVA